MHRGLLVNQLGQGLQGGRVTLPASTCNKCAGRRRLHLYVLGCSRRPMASRFACCSSGVSVLEAVLSGGGSWDLPVLARANGAAAHGTHPCTALLPLLCNQTSAGPQSVHNCAAWRQQGRAQRGGAKPARELAGWPTYRMQS
jgi:hypothetical protein